ncbi:MAG: hypothetical protein IJP20_03705 [Clostridia bacterium]|nr:hypothetical protein [Clostridia bacterium]
MDKVSLPWDRLRGARLLLKKVGKTIAWFVQFRYVTYLAKTAFLLAKWRRKPTSEFSWCAINI